MNWVAVGVHSPTEEFIMRTLFFLEVPRVGDGVVVDDTRYRVDYVLWRPCAGGELMPLLSLK